jgi:hypothetical protein
MKSIGFGAYDNFGSLGYTERPEKGLFSPEHSLFIPDRTLYQSLYATRDKPGKAWQRGLSGFDGAESMIGTLIAGLLVGSQIVAYIAKESNKKDDLRWRWYDTVLIPSYVLWFFIEMFRDNNK